MEERRRPIDKRLAGGTGDQRGKFLTKTSKKKPFVFEFGGSPGSPSVERECGGVALAGRPAAPVPPPSPILRARPRSPGEPQLSAEPGTLLPPVPLQGDTFHARGCNKLREHRTHSSDEGGQGGFYCGFLRFL